MSHTYYLYKPPRLGLVIKVRLSPAYIDLDFVSQGTKYYSYRIHSENPLHVATLLASGEFDSLPKCWQRQPYAGKIQDGCRYLLGLDIESNPQQRSLGILGKILKLKDLEEP